MKSSRASFFGGSKSVVRWLTSPTAMSLAGRSNARTTRRQQPTPAATVEVARLEAEGEREQADHQGEDRAEVDELRVDHDEVVEPLAERRAEAERLAGAREAPVVEVIADVPAARAE